MSRTFVRQWKPLVGVCSVCFSPTLTVTVSAPTPAAPHTAFAPSARLGYLDEVCEGCEERGVGLVAAGHTGGRPIRSVCPHCGRVVESRGPGIAGGTPSLDRRGDGSPPSPDLHPAPL